jgi:hypothetical protein
MTGTRWREWWERLIAHLEMFVFGAAMSWVMVPYVLRRRQEMERLFVVIASAGMRGLPCMPASSELRLLPYFIPSFLYWRRLTIFSHELEGVDLRHIGH